MKLDWEKFKPHFHESWWRWMRPFIESKECYEIYRVLKEKGNIWPKSGDVWKAFKYTDYDNLRCIIVAQSPYHTAERDVPYADGLAFSCSHTKKIAPSLRVLYDAIDDDLKVKVEREPNLDYLAMQEVLMLNLSLTISRGQKDSFGEHEVLWRPFIEYLFKQVAFSVTGVPIILFGSPASEQIVPLLDASHYFKSVKHPSYYARNNEKMEHKHVFSWTNKILEDNNRLIVRWDYRDFIDNELPF